MEIKVFLNLFIFSRKTLINFFFLQQKITENFKMSENLEYKDSNNCGDNLDGTYTISTGGGSKLHSQQQQQQVQTTTMAAATTNGRRFVNVDKFLMQR